MIMSGDMLCEHTPRMTRAAIRRVLSRSGWECHTSHNAPVYELGGLPWVLNAQPPRAKRDGVIEYLERIREAGGQYVIIRPLPLDLARHDGFKGWLRDFEMHHVRLCMAGENTRYPRRDNYLIWKKFTLPPAIRRFLPIRTPSFHMNCSERTREVALNNPAMTWRPREISGDLPSPLDFEHLVRSGAVVLIDEHPAGLWDQIMKTQNEG